MTDESTPHGRAQTPGASAFDASAFEFTIDAETSAAITPAKADVTPADPIVAVRQHARRGRSGASG